VVQLASGGQERQESARVLEKPISCEGQKNRERKDDRMNLELSIPEIE
jgi:hypothetical protein